MKCDICNSKNSYVKDYENVFEIKGKEIKFTCPRRFCQNYNSLMYDEKLDNECSLKAIELYNNCFGIPKDDLVIFRKNLNLSQELFAKIIGCAKKTLISYEKGTAIPNDNYMIVLKSLMAKPEMILTFIDANKGYFSEKEYTKIHNKVNCYLGNNIKGILLNESFIPTEFNGYTECNKNKVFNMILFLADSSILKTKLLKEMFYADFMFYKNIGNSITGLEYAKLQYGPVPNDFEKIIEECCKKNLIDYKVTYDNNLEYHEIIAKSKVNLNIFSNEEIEILKKIKEYFKDFSSKKIEDFSHKEKGYIETKMYKNISYDYAFDIESIK